MNFRVLAGKLLVSRDPDYATHRVPGTSIDLYLPDDMASAGHHSWAASDRMSQWAFCHQHNVSWWNDPDLTGMRVYFTKWAERTFEIQGRKFCILDESAILAYEETENEVQ